MTALTSQAPEASITIATADAYTIIHLKPAYGRGQSYYYNLAPDGDTLPWLLFCSTLSYSVEILRLPTLGQKLAGIFGYCVLAGSLLSGGFGKIEKGLPEENEKPGDFAAVRYPITTEQYWAMYKDLNSPFRVRYYSRPFFNCAHFAAWLTKRHGVPLPGNRFFANPERLRRNIRNIKPDDDMAVWSYQTRKCPAMWRYTFPIYTF